MSWANRPRKFVPGNHLRDIVEVATAIHCGSWIMYRDKPMHPAMIRNWSILQIESAARFGWLRLASPNPGHPSNRTPPGAVADDEFEEVEMPI